MVMIGGIHSIQIMYWVTNFKKGKKTMLEDLVATAGASYKDPWENLPMGIIDSDRELNGTGNEYHWMDQR